MRACWVVGLVIGCAAPSPPPVPPAVVATAPTSVAAPPPRTLPSTRIVALPDGAVVSDADSGHLLRTDTRGQLVANILVGRDAGMVAVANGRAYVADRTGNRIVVASLAAGGLARETIWPTRAEPFAITLTADGTTALVTLIADRALVAYDTATGAERYAIALPAEPRALAVSPDGTRALVTSNATGALLDISLTTRSVREVPLDITCDSCVDGPAMARATAVMFLDARRAIAAFQREVPSAIELFGVSASTSRYGASRLPITQHLAFLSLPASGPPTQVIAQIFANLPRSLAWDAEHDALYIGGIASDMFLRLVGLTGGSTTTQVARESRHLALRSDTACGPDGLAHAGDRMYAWCAFSRRVAVFSADGETTGPELIATTRSPEQHAGYVLFHATVPQVSPQVTCETCHLDTRTDGLSWRINTLSLQTPVLAGRVVGTAPYKWTGSDPTLAHSIARTVHRLGGSGLSRAQTQQLAAYLTSLPAPQRPTLDAAAVARGKAVFAAWDCGDCHRGAQFTDGQTYSFRSTIDLFETPSLVGLHASAPYYHDGSAPTLEALLAGHGSVRGMSDFAALTEPQRADLAAYLRSL